MEHLGTPEVSSTFVSKLGGRLCAFVTGRQGNANKINEHSSMKTPTKTQLFILVSSRLHYRHEVRTIQSPRLSHNSVLDKPVVFFIFLYFTVHILFTKYIHSFIHSFIHSKHVQVSRIIFLGSFTSQLPAKFLSFPYPIFCPF
jgi:hypothetical protein